MAQRRRGGGNELLKIRDYRVGDPLRQVHWKASARRGQLLVRENTEENDQAYCLRVESSPDLWPDAEQFERMCAFAGSLAEDLFVRGRLAGMIIDGDFLPAQRMQDLETIFEAVSRMVRGGVPRPRGVEAVALPSWPMIEFRPGAGGAVNCELEGVHAGSA